MGYKIREAREKRGMTQEELCEKANVSRATLSGLETGRSVNATADTISKIAKALNMKVGDIFYVDKV